MDNYDLILESITNSEPQHKDTGPIYTKIDPTKNYEKYTQCSHVFIYAKTNSKFLNLYDKKAIILMQVRFDGFLGFPGGVVDPGESPVEALNRELQEESGWFEENGPISQDHHLFSHVNDDELLVLHFYAVEVTEEKIKEIELNTLKAPEYGEEVLGNCRVPLYVMKDKYHGFPSFLHNNFIGNAKTQLIQALITLKLLPPECIIKALNLKQR